MLRNEMRRRKEQNERLQRELETLRRALSEARALARNVKTPESDQVVVTFDGQREDAECHFQLKEDFSLGADEMSGVTQETSLSLNRKMDELEYRARHQAMLEAQYQKFCMKEKTAHDQRRAVVLERARRLLQDSPDMPIPDKDEFTVEDQAATRVQRIMRGKIGRARVRLFRRVTNDAATVIQGFARGYFGRSRAYVRKLDKGAVTIIQRIWRGHADRCHVESFRFAQEENSAARRIQKLARGQRGRRRVKHKRALQQSAVRGSEVVGVTQLFHRDVVELVNAIDASERAAPSLPGIVLGLLKVVALMLNQDQEAGAVARYSNLGVRSVEMLEPAQQFSWRDALRLLRRSSRFLRRLRQVAEGPAGRRPRMIFLSVPSVQTYRALRCDQWWDVEMIGRIGNGAKACKHLMMWVDALQEVFAYQHNFTENFGNDRMSWIERARQSMRCMRHLALSEMVWKHAVSALQHVIDQLRVTSLEKHDVEYPAQSGGSRKGDLRLCIAERAMEISRHREACARDALSKIRREEHEAQADDENREQSRLDALVTDFHSAEANVQSLSLRLERAKAAARGDLQADQAHLRQCLDELTTCEVIRRERWTSLQIFRTRVEQYTKRRGVEVEVWGDLRRQVREVGELEAASLLDIEELNFLKSCVGLAEATADPAPPDVDVLQAKAEEAQMLAAAAENDLNVMEEEKENAYAISCEAEVRFPTGDCP